MAKFKTDKSFHVASLIIKHLNSGLTETEKIELETWQKKSESNRQLFADLTNTDSLESQLEEFGKRDAKAGWLRAQEMLNSKREYQHRSRYRRMIWQAAAAVLILALAGWQIWVSDFKNPDEQKKLSHYGQDIAPGTFKAQLLLSDGSTVSLGNRGDTSFTENGSLVHRSADGTIKYEGGNNPGDHVAWNILRVPNAGEYMVILEDGSRVWLNAATTLRYPVQFAGKERRVELLAGEAYFEIKKNNEKPFIVVTDQMEVLAVGTAFNVNSYLAEAGSISATLAEGKVRVSAKNAIRFLSPGDQAVLYRDHDNRIEVSGADLEVVLAWKNGLFVFNDTPLPDVMQQLARWYDVDIEYDKTFKEKKNFTGEIRRNVPVSKLLQMMEMTGIARFRIIDNTVVVMPFNP